MRAGFWMEDPMKRDDLKDLGLDGKVIVKLIFEKWDGDHGLDLSGSGQG